jgi:hypothetical protein
MDMPRRYHGDVVIDLVPRWWQMIPGIVVTLALGVIALHGAVTGALYHDTSLTRIISFVIGAVSLLISLWGGWMFVASRRPQCLVIGADGVRHELPGGAGFEVRWRELSGVAVSCTTGSGRSGRRRTAARLLMVPKEAEFEARHREMARFRRDDRRYQFPIGTRRSTRNRLRAALERHAGGLDYGVVDEPHRSSYV